MNKWLGHLGDRMQFLRMAALITGFCTVVAFVLALAMLKQDRIGPAGFVGIILLGVVLAAVLAGLMWVGVGASSRALVTTMTGAGNITPAPSYSLQESLVARGRYAEAEESYLEHLQSSPADLDARLALAALVRDHAGDPARAERLFLEARAQGPTAAQEFAIANALIDLYRDTAQRGREMTELARFAERYRETEAGRKAKAALNRLKREEA
jgi:tetratricopeptide (TPR) repeat protein